MNLGIPMGIWWSFGGRFRRLSSRFEKHWNAEDENGISRWWFQTFYKLSPWKLGFHDPIWREAYYFKWVVHPPASYIIWALKNPLEKWAFGGGLQGIQWDAMVDTFWLRTSGPTMGSNEKKTTLFRVYTWRILPVSKWLITMVSKSPKWGYSPYKWPKWLINGGY